MKTYIYCINFIKQGNQSKIHLLCRETALLELLTIYFTTKHLTIAT